MTDSGQDASATGAILPSGLGLSGVDGGRNLSRIRRGDGGWSPKGAVLQDPRSANFVRTEARGSRRLTWVNPGMGYPQHGTFRAG